MPCGHPLLDVQNLLEALIHVMHTLRKRCFNKTAGPGTLVSWIPITQDVCGCAGPGRMAGREAHRAEPSLLVASAGATRSPKH